MPATDQCSRGSWPGESGPDCAFTHAVDAGHRQRRAGASRTVAPLDFSRQESETRPQAAVLAAIHAQIETRRRSRRKHADEELNAVFTAIQKFGAQH